MVGIRTVRILSLVLSAGALPACETLTPQERASFEQLKREGLLEPEKFRDPTLAGMLNVLPGLGNVYLRQWGLFGVNLLTWPLSLTWGISQAIHDAETINIRETVFYYEFGPGRSLRDERDQLRKKNDQSGLP
jgi:hypothetical protein